MKPISDAEVEKRIKAWADMTKLSLELKHAALRKRYPDLAARNKIPQLNRCCLVF